MKPTGFFKGYAFRIKTYNTNIYVYVLIDSDMYLNRLGMDLNTSSMSNT